MLFTLICSPLTVTIISELNAYLFGILKSILTLYFFPASAISLLNVLKSSDNQSTFVIFNVSVPSILTSNLEISVDSFSPTTGFGVVISILDISFCIFAFPKGIKIFQINSYGKN